MEKKKMFLLDAYALIFRAYYAFINRPIVNSKGLNTSAVFGFVTTLDEVIRNQKPDYLAVVFDPPGPTFRKDMYKEYKANREETPEDIRQSIPYIKQVIEAFNIPCIEAMGYEADDVIGTLAKRWANDQMHVFMMTPDKDYAQLIDENISMYKPGRSGNEAEVIDINNFNEKYGLDKPNQIIDMLTLMGDTSDNIPGVPGIGPKTAVKLLNTYGNIDKLLANINQLKGKQKENIDGSRDIIELSKKLVTIECQVPVETTLDELKYEELNKQKVESLFEELEFRTLKKRILGDEPALSNIQPKSNTIEAQGSLFANEVTVSNFKTFTDSVKDYQLADNDTVINQIIEEVRQSNVFCFDTETTSLDSLTAEIVGLAISTKTDNGYYVPIKNNGEEAKELLQKFIEVFENETIIKVGHNLKYDIQIVKNYEIQVKGLLFDTMVAHYLLEPDKKHKLDILAEDYLQYKMISIESLIGKKGAGQANMKNVEVNKVKDYACEDADVTLQLYQLFKADIEKNNLKSLMEKIEMPLIEVLRNIEENGVNLDLDGLAEYAKKLNAELIDIEEKIYSHVNFKFNINSPKQLGEILFDRLKIEDNAKKTKTKQYSTSEETLQKLADKHPIVNQILDFRSLKKLLSTYIEALPKLVSERTGRVHTSFNQTIAATGRLSSTNPNLQNIPIREDRGREIRKAFVPRGNDFVILSADYSQIELRLMAHLSGDDNMIEAFTNNEDIHASTAAKIYKTDISEVSRETRSKAKTANFGIIYGISAFGLSQRLNIPRGEAKELIDGYFETFPKVKLYMDEAVQKGRENGYVETIFGRRRYLKDINSRNAIVRGVAERNAINAPIQGSAADVIKIAMINIYDTIRTMKSKMILQVHDELVFDVYKPELEELQHIVKEKMEQAYQLSVPLIVDMNYGNNWLEAH